jgi:GNAT superfamily N-acetyltransferase
LIKYRSERAQLIQLNPTLGDWQPYIPELGIAVLPEHRGRGIGTKLLMAAIESTVNIYPGISLSVRSENPVISLYRVGFVEVEGIVVSNLTAGTSMTMLYKS